MKDVNKDNCKRAAMIETIATCQQKLEINSEKIEKNTNLERSPCADHFCGMEHTPLKFVFERNKKQYEKQEQVQHGQCYRERQPCCLQHWDIGCSWVVSLGRQAEAYRQDRVGFIRIQPDEVVEHPDGPCESKTERVEVNASSNQTKHQRQQKCDSRSAQWGAHFAKRKLLLLREGQPTLRRHTYAMNVKNDVAENKRHARSDEKH